MTINIDITDDQAKALATSLRVKSYLDGNDLIKQAVDMAMNTVKQRNIITAIAQQPTQPILDAVITAYNSVSGTKIPLATGTKV